jgi:hypothetical protein
VPVWTLRAHWQPCGKTHDRCYLFPCLYLFSGSFPPKESNMSLDFTSGLVLKIHNGTVRGGRSLCCSCKSAHRIVGTGCQSLIRCAELSRGSQQLIDFDVAECNRYSSATQVSLDDMEEIAWRLVTHKSGHRIGFVDPAQFRRMEWEKEPK